MVEEGEEVTLNCETQIWTHLQLGYCRQGIKGARYLLIIHELLVAMVFSKMRA